MECQQVSQAVVPPQEAELLAEILWESMQEDPEEDSSVSGFRGLWRSKVYYRIVRASRRRIREHKNPEPFLSARVALQRLSGERIRRSQARYEGVIGGELTDREYTFLRRGVFASPIILVSGFPRSGTTSLQALIRAGFPRHVCEVQEDASRFSLWEQPKHDFSAMLAVANECTRGARILLAVREFKGALASLMVGRGHWTTESNEADLRAWLSWLPVAVHPQTIVVPFPDIAASMPADMLESLGGKLGLAPENDLRWARTYRDVLSATGSGDTSDVQKGNLPSKQRETHINEAMKVIDSQFGSRSSQIDAVYQEMVAGN